MIYICVSKKNISFKKLLKDFQITFTKSLLLYLPDEPKGKQKFICIDFENLAKNSKMLGLFGVIDLDASFVEKVHFLAIAGSYCFY